MGDAGIAVPLPEAPVSVSQPSLDLVRTQPREIHVLVTGFGAFKSFTNNPSYLIASALPSTLSPAPPPPPVSKEETKSQPVRSYLPSFLNRHVSANSQTQDNTRSAYQPIRTPNEKPYIIHIHTYPDPIYVAYAPTSVTIPPLLDPATNGTIFSDFPGGIDFDYVFHIGLASGRDSYTLETLAHRDDYLIPDVDDSVGTALSDMWKRQDVPGSLEVGWDGADVLRRWKAEVERRETEDSLEEPHISAFSAPTSKDELKETINDTPSQAWAAQHGVLRSSSIKTQTNEVQTPKPNTNLPSYTPIGGGTILRQSTTPKPLSKAARKSVVKLSRDAGRFLCEFILMCSLIQRYKEHQHIPIASDSESKLGKVAFLHVPNGTEPADVARGAMIAESAIRALVASWEGGWRNGDVYEDEGEGVQERGGGAGAGVGVGVVEGGFEEKGTGDEIPR